MADKIIENNQVSIMGKIATGFTFSHLVFGEGFYTMELIVKRLSDSEDRIPVMVSERLIDVTQDYIGEYIEIHGQFRSYNRHEEKHNRLVLSVFAREVKFVEEDLYGWFYMQTAGLSQDSSWKRNCRYPAGSEPALWKIRLHTMHLLGQKCAICFGVCSRRTCTSVGPYPEQGIYEAYR